MRATCIRCLDAEAVVALDLDGSGYFRCQSCGEEFTADDVRDTLDAMKRWEKLLVWAEACPVEAEEVTA